MLGRVIGDILQPTHLLFVLVVALLVLGPKRLPEVGRSLGKGLRDFRGALSGDDRDEPSIPEHHTPSPAPQATAPQPVAPQAADTSTTETPSADEAVHPTSVETPSGEHVEQHVA
jgi:sec-independent protein translocase protein TatA